MPEIKLPNNLRLKQMIDQGVTDKRQVIEVLGVSPYTLRSWLQMVRTMPDNSFELLRLKLNILN